MKCLRYFAFGFSFLALASAPLLESPLSQQGDFTITDNVNLVLLEVSVKDAQAGFVLDLQKSDFRVLEDGKQRTITHFGNIDAPVTVGLVVDNSGSMRTKRTEVMQAGLAFARQSNPQDEFFVVNFNDQVVSGLPPQLPFTDSLQVLQKALYYGKPVGQTALYDAISYSLRHLETAHLEQRTLIVVSDGGDNVSKIALPELLNQIESSRATIYTIGLLDPDDSDLNPRILRKLAAVSGGGYFQPRALGDVPLAFAQISKDIRHRYSVGFAPDEEHDKRTVRTVKVTAERAGQRLTCKSRSFFRIPATK
jgi:Ca-activated chloride channel family protein